MKIVKDKINDYFRWVKGTELVELDDIDVSEDPVRPELTLGWRITMEEKYTGFNMEMKLRQLCVLHILMIYQKVLENWI